MDYQATEIKAGLVIFASLAILIAFLVAIFGIDYGKETKEYVTFLENVAGISEGSLVKYGGLDVGHVSAVTLPEGGEGRIKLKLTVDQKTPVKVDSKAFVTSVGIMADNHIEISPGSPNADLLPPGSVLPSKEVLGFSQMAEPLAELNAQLQELLVRVTDLFNAENRGHLNSMLSAADSLMSGSGGKIEGALTNLEAVTANLASLSGELRELLEKNRGSLQNSLVHIDSTTYEMARVVAQFRDTLSQLDQMMAQNSGNLVQIMENFQYVSQNLGEFTRMVKERPWLLVRKAAPPERKLP